MTLTQLIGLLRARWKLVTLLVLGLSAAALVVSLLLPKQYMATATMVVDVRANPINNAGVDGMMVPTFMSTQMDIIRSDRVAQRAAEILELAKRPELRDAWLDATEGRGSMEAWLAQWMAKGLEVKPARESGVINLSFKAADSKFAADAANAYTRAYADTVLTLRVDPASRYTSFFEERSKALKQQLDAAQARLAQYQKEHGIIATDERLDAEVARLNELSAQIVMVQALAAESGSRQVAAQGGSAEQMQDVLLNPVIAQLKSNVSAAEARLNELNSRLGENHPQVIEAQANIRALRSRLAAETAKVTSGVTVSAQINRRREAEIRAAYETQRQRVLNMREQRTAAASILRDVESAQRAYEAIQTRLNQTSLESQSNQTYVSVLSPAVEPIIPSSPRIVLNTLLGVFVGTVLAIATVLLLEGRNRRVRGVTDLVEIVGLPIVGVLPGPEKGAWGSDKRRPLLVRRLLGQMPEQRRA